MKKTAIILIFITALFLATPVLAIDNQVKPPVVDCTQGANIPDHYVGLCNILGAFNLIIAILVVATIAFFIWGIAKYLISGGDEAKAKSAKSAMVYGVIGLAVIFGVNAILSYVGGFLGINFGNSLISFFG